MKTIWSSISLVFMLFLYSCGSEQFGTVPQRNSSETNAVTAFQQASCSGHTLIKPEVDILYVVDNSTSSYYLADDIKQSIKNTISSISSEFDYRVIGTPLIETANGNEDYQVLSKSSLPSTFSSKQVASHSEFTFFTNNVPGSYENGLERIRSFISAHSSDGLFRKKSYLLVILISNGRDKEIESDAGYGNGETVLNTAKYSTRLSELQNLKTYLESQQFRLFSLTANTSCKPGWLSSMKSYAKMSKDLYLAHTPALSSNPPTWPDHFDLCGKEISKVFSEVNSTIKQVIIPHHYKYWPITFTNATDVIDVSTIKVFKSSPNSAPVQLTTGWQYVQNPNYPSAINTRTQPSAGEPTTARHLIEFNPEIVYPDCIQVTSTSNLEYFNYIVIPKAPKIETIEVKINGVVIPKSDTNGWSYTSVSQPMTLNIKIAHNGYPDTPAVIKSGYMIKLNGASNYYKSGDNVEIYYLPAPI